ncbi:MotA/TolQ/ExbB proton channel family protein [Roseimicrobium sp. ORNL1]|uniref:MotA/TolQ/ExbB proton channel family protein n=1 Tax=Roseimicrobium sp. ORNL1 TaxID=2711231 RepID=UPI001F114CBF|nr:MotA/TolQ/ExbB proton channel family protein [Roseimicrobium sp. ORNL1]
MHITSPNRTRSRTTQWIGRLLVCGTLLCGSINAFAEEATAPAAAGEAGKAAVHRKTMLQKFQEGGWVMYPILGFSVLTIWLSVDLWIRTGKKKLAPDAHVNGAKDLFRMGDYVGAYQHCKNNPSAFSDATRVALSFIGDGQQATEDAMIGELNKFNAATTTRINYLSVIGVCTPMVGLLGTVTGMVTAFEHLGTAGVGDPSGLSAAIGEVLIATASGLAIAIPAFMMFYVCCATACRVPSTTPRKSWSPCSARCRTKTSRTATWVRKSSSLLARTGWRTTPVRPMRCLPKRQIERSLRLQAPISQESSFKQSLTFSDLWAAAAVVWKAANRSFKLLR